MEIIAVYSEQKIRTYGFNIHTGLRLTSATLSVKQLAAWGDRLKKHRNDCDFVMVVAQMTGKHVLRAHCLFDPAMAMSEYPAVEHFISALTGSDVSVAAPVELVYFQGPHFGDRYGIADSAFGALASHGLKVLVAGCTGASIYIVVPDATAQSATRCLSKAFQVPEPTME